MKDSSATEAVDRIDLKVLRALQTPSPKILIE